MYYWRLHFKSKLLKDTTIVSALLNSGLWLMQQKTWRTLFFLNLTYFIKIQVFHLMFYKVGPPESPTLYLGLYCRWKLSCVGAIIAIMGLFLNLKTRFSGLCHYISVRNYTFWEVKKTSRLLSSVYLLINILKTNSDLTGQSLHINKKSYLNF